MRRRDKWAVPDIPKHLLQVYNRLVTIEPSVAFQNDIAQIQKGLDLGATSASGGHGGVDDAADVLENNSLHYGERKGDRPK